MNLNVQTDRTLIRATSQSTRYVLLSFTAPEPRQATSRAPVNIALVIDRSGSMGGKKIELARKAVVQALQMLRSTDRFSVVCYDHEVEVVVPSTLATSEAVRNAIAQVQGLQARGNTDLGGGWLKGCEQIAQQMEPEQVGCCLLLSDGLANHGITDRDELAQHAQELRRRNVTTSTFGIGLDFDERLLEGMARAAAGHFYYIETAAQIPDFLTSELGETLETVARDVAVSVRAGEGIEIEPLNRFAFARGADGNVLVRLGDLIARQDVSLVFRVKFPTGTAKATAQVTFDVKDRNAALNAPVTDILWTYDDHAANDAQPRNVIVDRAVARLFLANAQAEALELNREGQYEEAQERLRKVGRRIASYAGSDPELLAIISELDERGVVYSRAMSSGGAETWSTSPA